MYPMRIQGSGQTMRHLHVFMLAVAMLLVIQIAPSVRAQDQNRAVEGGGIAVPGWTGRIDPKELAAGEKLSNAKLAKEGDAMRVTTGPALVYWSTDNKASGHYTVKATFKEPQYMNLNNHPHPYGIFIAGNGSFIVRGFGPAPFQMNGGRGATHAAVNKAAGKGEPVTQEIALSVKGDKVECAINGTVVATYDKSALVSAGKLKSTDGMYGIRFAHNTDAVVTGFTMTKH